MESRINLSVFYDLEVVAQTGGGQFNFSSLGNGPSINDSGIIAFTGTSLNDGNVPADNVYAYHPNNSETLALMNRAFMYPNAGCDTTAAATQCIFGQVQINNSGEVLARRRLNARVQIGVPFGQILTAPLTYVETWNAFYPGPPFGVSSSLVAMGDGGAGPAGGLMFFLNPATGGVYPSPFIVGSNYAGLFAQTSLNNFGEAAFGGILSNANGGGWRLATGPGPTWTDNAINYRPYPSMADTGTVVVRDGATEADAIVAYDWTLSSFQTVAGASNGFTRLSHPGISDDGRAIAFAGQHTTLGSGVFVSVNNGAVFGAPVKVAGISGDGILEGNEEWNDADNDGVVDVGEDEGFFSAFSGFDMRVAVNRAASNNSSDYAIAFLANDLTGALGLHTVDVNMSASPLPESSEPTTVASIGDSPNGLGGTVQDIRIHDTVNNSGSLAFWVSTGGGSAIVSAERFSVELQSLSAFEDLQIEDVPDEIWSSTPVSVGGPAGTPAPPLPIYDAIDSTQTASGFEIEARLAVTGAPVGYTPNIRVEWVIPGSDCGGGRVCKGEKEFTGLTGRFTVATPLRVGKYDVEFKFFSLTGGGSGTRTHIRDVTHPLYYTFAPSLTGTTPVPGTPSLGVPEDWLKKAVEFAQGATSKLDALDRINDNITHQGWVYSNFGSHGPFATDWQNMLYGTDIYGNCHSVRLVWMHLAQTLGINVLLDRAIDDYRGAHNAGFITKKGLKAFDGTTGNAQFPQTPGDLLTPGDRWRFGWHALARFVDGGTTWHFDATFNGRYLNPAESIEGHSNPSLPCPTTWCTDNGIQITNVAPAGTVSLPYPHSNLNQFVRYSPALVSIVDAAAITESGGAVANFTVSLSRPVDEPVRVRWQTENGTADDSDYVSIVAGDITIPPLTTNIVITVPIRDDSVVESSETFFVRIISVSGAAVEIARDLGSATILDNDMAGPAPPAIKEATALDNALAVGANAANGAGDAFFAGGLSAFAIDDEGDGTFNSLGLDIDVIGGAGDHSLVGLLRFGGEVVSTRPSSESQLFSGDFLNLSSGVVATARVSFSGDDIFNSEFDGDYSIDLRLIDAAGMLVDSTTIVLPGLSHADFGEQPARLAGISDHVVDTNGDSLFDLLIVEASSAVYQPGKYAFALTLEDSNGRVFATDTVQQDMSLQSSVEITIDGRVLRASGMDGPYTGVVRMYDSFGTLLEMSEFSTSAYSHSSFALPAAEVAGVANHRGVDSDANGLFNELVFDLDVDVHEAGDYRVQGWLAGANGELITTVNTLVSLAEGDGQIELSFDGAQIGKSGAVGPYHLAYVSLRQVVAADGFLATAVDVFSTAAYARGQFELGMNSLPVAVDDAASVALDAPVVVEVLSNDFDVDGTVNPASVRITRYPTHGTVLVNADLGTITFTPSLGFRGVDTFEYDIRDDVGALSQPATVSVSVGAGDLDGDGNVGLRDLIVLRSHWGQVGEGISADLNFDGQVNAGDLALLVRAFGQRAAPTAAPAAAIVANASRTVGVDLGGPKLDLRARRTPRPPEVISAVDKAHDEVLSTTRTRRRRSGPEPRTLSRRG